MSKSPEQGRTRLAVVGGGVIGLSTAWRAAQAGHHVVLIDPAPAAGASWVAGGMLAPVSEAWPGDEDVLRLGEASLRRWPAFAAELGEVGLRTGGTLVVAHDSADREQLHTLAAYLGEQGREVHEHTGRELRRMEPALGSSVRSGLYVPGELAVDARKLLRALDKAARNAGVRLRTRSATEVRPGEVTLDDGGIEPCDVVVIAAGARSAGLHPGLAHAVRPLKGEILRLRARRGTLPPPSRTVRASVEARPVYLVPKDDDELMLGATQYEAGFDTDVTVGGVRDLIADAERVLPGIAEYELVECAAGSRAGSADNLPVIGWLEPGVLAAAGHHRNGLLLAPITADAVCAYLAGTEPGEHVTAAAPARLSREVL